MTIIAYQPEFRPVLPTVFGPKEYREFRETLIEMDHILTETGLEQRIIARKVAELGNPVSSAYEQSSYRRYLTGLRYNILLSITGYSFRELAIRISDSHLFQWFTYVEVLGKINPLSKSSIERYEKLFSDKEITELIHGLNQAAADERQGKHLLYQEAALRFDTIFAESLQNLFCPHDLRQSEHPCSGRLGPVPRRGPDDHESDPAHPETGAGASDRGPPVISDKDEQAVHGNDAYTEEERSGESAEDGPAKHEAADENHETAWRTYCSLRHDCWQETDWSEAEAQNVL